MIKKLLLATILMTQTVLADANSDYFRGTVLPNLQSMVAVNLPEYNSTKVDLVNKFPISPETFTLQQSVNDFRIYFVGENADYKNKVGVNGDIAFNNASIPPLTPGDFVNMGNFNNGTLLDFFIIANGNNDNKFSMFGNNPDCLTHAIAMQSSIDTSYWLIGFEDIRGGGDKDYNDVLIAVQMPVVTPEPSLMIILLTGIGIAMVVKSRRTIQQITQL